jgi:hypothetical protein
MIRGKKLNPKKGGLLYRKMYMFCTQCGKRQALKRRRCVKCKGMVEIDYPLEMGQLALGMGRYDRKGRPLRLLQWGRMMEDLAYRRVAETTLDDGKWVSTVWLGLDHSFGGGERQIFETMVFSGEGKKGRMPKFEDGKLTGEDGPEYIYHEDLYCERYATEMEAQLGHVRIVARFRKGDGNGSAGPEEEEQCEEDREGSGEGAGVQDGGDEEEE